MFLVSEVAYRILFFGDFNYHVSNFKNCIAYSVASGYIWLHCCIQWLSMNLCDKIWDYKCEMNSQSEVSKSGMSYWAVLFLPEAFSCLGMKWKGLWWRELLLQLLVAVCCSCLCSCFCLELFQGNSHCWSRKCVVSLYFVPISCCITFSSVTNKHLPKSM